MTRAILLTLILTLNGVLPLVAEPTTTISPRSDSLDLLLLAGEKPVRLELRVEIDGTPVPALWDETFAALLAFHDWNSDGFLSRSEATRLPSSFALRQVMWGQFVATNEAPPWADLDLNADSKLNVNEIADHYRREGLGGVIVGVGTPPVTDRLTDTLTQKVDTNRDGRTTEAEWKAAAEVLRVLDVNGDELVRPDELIGKILYPGAMGSILLRSPRPGRDPAPGDQLPLVVLPLRTADEDWVTVLTKKRKLMASELQKLRETPAAITWRAEFGKAEPTHGRFVHEADRVRLELRLDEGTLAEKTTTTKNRLTGMFTESDANGDGTLDPDELGAARGRVFTEVLTVTDRDEDRSLSGKEFRAWLQLHSQVAKGHVLLTILDHGTGLFEVLDADHDGALSVRELRTAWNHLQEAECVTEGNFDRTRLPRQLMATIARGHPRSSPGKPIRKGPDWAKGMDRNGDGDVSRREFIGPADVFDRIDLDKDGLLDGDETTNASMKK